MKRCRKRLIWLLTICMMLCFSSVAMAAYHYDPEEAVLSRVQGEWYDSNGNVVLNFQGNTVNGCAIVGVYNVAGGRSDFHCIIRIVESNGYRDLSISGEQLEKGYYHSHVILHSKAGDYDEGTLLMRTKKAQYYESVGGIYLDTPEKEVLAKYGKPDRILNVKPWEGFDTWRYQKLGLDLTMRYHHVWQIKIYRNGNRHFDRTGFNCWNTAAEFQKAYGFYKTPEAKELTNYRVANGEYLWFDDYPDSLTLSMLNN